MAEEGVMYADRRFLPAMAQDAVAHDPKSGQFVAKSGGSHEEMAAYHKEHQARHEGEAKARGETTSSAYGSHGNASGHHYSAAFHHSKAAENPNDAEYEKQADKHTKIANQASTKVAKAGAKYDTPADKPRIEKPAMTSQEHSAKRIGAYLARNRIRMR